MIEHSGISYFKVQDKPYVFQHLGYDGKNRLTWKSLYNAQEDELSHSSPSEDANSLLYSLLDSPREKVVLFTRPGLNSDVIISVIKSDQTQIIKKLSFVVKYTFYQESK